jgi:hypothetical protein
MKYRTAIIAEVWEMHSLNCFMQATHPFIPQKQIIMSVSALKL